MRKLLWYAVCAVNFYLLVAFAIVGYTLQGMTADALQATHLGVVIAGVNLLAFSGLYIYQTLPKRYRQSVPV